MGSNSQIRELLSATRRRRIAHLLLDQAAVALCLAMGGAALLLVLGTQILDWYWPAALFVVALAARIYRIRSRMPESYRLLQEIDARLSFKDALSTAYYFDPAGGVRQGREEIRAAQRGTAEELARTTDSRSALPFVLPKSVYAAVVSVVLAGSLFGLRYGILHSLDLKPPITEAVSEFFRPSEEMVKAWEENEAAEAEAEITEPEPTAEKNKGKFDREADSKLTAAEALDVPADGLAPDTSRPADESADPWDGGSEGEDSDGSDGAPPPPAAEDLDVPDDGEDAPNFPEPESDLLRKMQDAFANLLSKLKIPPQAAKNRRVSSQDGTSESQKKRKKMSEKASMSPQGESMQQTGQQVDEAQPGGQQTQAGQAEAPGQKSGQPGQQSAKSGSGQRDGDKELKLAQQMEAMGQIEEILGERAENIKGDIMVEVSSGPQRLRTAYSETEASHGAGGGEIHRDEIPLELQPYVQRYFDEVRKGTGESAEAPEPSSE